MMKNKDKVTITFLVLYWLFVMSFIFFSLFGFLYLATDVTECGPTKCRFYDKEPENNLFIKDSEGCYKIVYNSSSIT